MLPKRKRRLKKSTTQRTARNAKRHRLTLTNTLRNLKRSELKKAERHELRSLKPNRTRSSRKPRTRKPSLKISVTKKLLPKRKKRLKKSRR